MAELGNIRRGRLEDMRGDSAQLVEVIEDLDNALATVIGPQVAPMTFPVAQGVVAGEIVGISGDKLTKVSATGTWLGDNAIGIAGNVVNGRAELLVKGHVLVALSTPISTVRPGNRIFVGETDGSGAVGWPADDYAWHIIEIGIVIKTQAPGRALLELAPVMHRKGQP